MYISQKEITRLLVDLDEFHSCFYPILFLLHLLVHKLPGAPLGKQVSDVSVPMKSSVHSVCFSNFCIVVVVVVVVVVEHTD